MLEHPQMSSFSCEDCKQWIYSIQTGDMVLRGGQPQQRKDNQPTPCWTCPRKSPEHAKTLTLSDRNNRTFVLYLRNRALFGRALTDDEAADRIVQKNLGLLDLIMRRWESSDTRIAMGALCQVLSRK